MTKTKTYSLKQLASLLPYPPADAHKYSRGKAVLVAGSARYPGAACLAATACEKMGAGYTQVLCAPEAVPLVRSASSSLVVSSWTGLFARGPFAYAANLGILDPQSLRQSSATNSAQFNNDTELNSACGTRLVGVSDADLQSTRVEVQTPVASGPADVQNTSCTLPSAQSYLVGSGFDSREPEAAALVLAVLAGAQSPVVVDGGGLAAVASDEGRRLLKERFEQGFPTVLTPHAGEAARLVAPFGFEADNPEKLCSRLSLAYGALVVLKGQTTYVSDGDATYLMDKGTPALAKAGTGDVLAGMLSSLLAQGLAPVDASMLATTLHALSGCAAAKQLTDICVRASDVVDFLPQAILSLNKAASRE